MIKEIFSSTAFEISPLKSAALRIGSSRSLQVESGMVWVTRSGDAADYWLAAGTTLALRAGETLWLSAELGHSARVVFRRPGRGTPHGIKRSLRWLAARLRRGWHGGFPQAV